MVRDRLSTEQEELEGDLLWQWVVRRGNCWWTRTDAVEAMQETDAGMSKATVYRRLTDWIDKGRLESDGATSGKEHLRRKQP